MIVRAGRISIFADGKRVGWYFFQSSILSAKIYGEKIRFIFSPVSGISALRGTEEVGSMSADVLDYNGEKYRIIEIERESYRVPAIQRTSDGTIIAVSNRERSMELTASIDPVLIVFSIMSLCLVESLPASDTSVSAKVRFLMKSERVKNMHLLPIIFVTGTVVFILLSQTYDSGIPSMILIAGYAGFLIGSMIFFMVRALSRRVRIVYSGQ